MGKINLEVGKSYRDTAQDRVDIRYHVDGVTDGRDYVGVVHTRHGVILRTFARDGTSISGTGTTSIVSVWRPTIAPGWWECRGGQKRYLIGCVPDELDTQYKWVGIDPDNGFVMRWTDDGQYCIWNEFEWDLIRPTTAPVKE